MKLIIAGTRHWLSQEAKEDYGANAHLKNQEICDKLVSGALLSQYSHLLVNISEVVSGCAIGIDKAGEKFAKEHNIKVTQFPANWNKYKKSAGFKRNEEMADYADALLVIWNGTSNGTKHMIETMHNKKKAIHFYDF